MQQIAETSLKHNAMARQDCLELIGALRAAPILGKEHLEPQLSIVACFLDAWRTESRELVQNVKLFSSNSALLEKPLLKALVETPSGQTLLRHGQEARFAAVSEPKLLLLMINKVSSLPL
jgi:hypothetical protein